LFSDTLAATAPPGKGVIKSFHAIARKFDPSGQQLRLTEQQYARFMQQVGLATWSLPTAAIDCSSAAEDVPQQRALIEQQ